MYDHKLTTYSEMLTKAVATGQSIPNEGAVLVYVEEDGVQKIQLSGVGPGETFAGFSAIDNYQPEVTNKIEAGTIPANPGPWVVSLSHSNLVAGQIRIYDIDAVADMTEVAGPVPGDNQYVANDTTGVITFNTLDHDHAIIVYYKYNLTVAESIMLFHQRHANAGASAFWDVLEVISGQGEMWTDQFDISKDYRNLAANKLVSGANGLLTVRAAAEGTPIGIVIHVPDQTNPYIGVKYTVTNKVGA